MAQTRWQRMAPSFWIKQGDTAPSIAYQLEDGDGTPVDITGAAVKFIMYAPGASSPKVNTAATITTAATGMVAYTFNASDTDAIGDYLGEFQVTFAGGAVETWPDGDWLKIRILDDLA
jgi:hypothetical protein